jgi:hypothetical protein
LKHINTHIRNPQWSASRFSVCYPDNIYRDDAPFLHQKTCLVSLPWVETLKRSPRPRYIKNLIGVKMKNTKYHIVGTIPELNRKCTGISIKGDEIKLLIGQNLI